MVLNVLGVYYPANNQMLTHGYKKHKTSKQFLEFIKLVDRKYDDNGETDISSLDNATIHKSKIVKETLFRNIHEYLVFLPTRSPELNLKEARWLWLHRRQAINNSIFENE
jgi:transposase